MANKKIQYTGEFDVTNILAGLRKVATDMKNMSTSTNMFKGIDKDFNRIEKLVVDIKSQIAEGFSNNRAIGQFTKNINTLYSALGHVETELREIGTSPDFKLRGIENAQEDIQKFTKEIDKLKKNLSDSQKNVQTSLSGLGFKSNKAKDISKQVVNATQLEAKLKDITKQRARDLEIQERQAELDRAGVNSTAREKISSLLETKDVTVSGGGRGAKTAAASLINERISQEMESVINGSQTIEQAWQNITSDAQGLGIILNNSDSLLAKLNSIYDQMRINTQEIENNLNNARNNLEAIGTVDESGNVQLSNSSQNMISTFEREAPRDYTQRITELESQIADRNQQIATLNEGTVLQDTMGQLADVHNELETGRQRTENYTEELIEMGQTQENVNQTFENLGNSIKTLISIGSAINGVRKIITNTFEDVKQLDKSFAEIAMVTDYSVEQMWKSYNQYAAMANQLGQSTQSVIQASGLFYQQGLETEEALALTEDTMKLATLAGLDFAKATSQMTAALRGFHLEMNEGARVTDVYSELAAKAAADVQGIAYAMSKTASIASSAGMEFETTSAFLTQMIETTQEAPENIGTAMKTIIARFTELKENVAGTADSEFEDLDYNKVDKALKTVGVSLIDLNGQFRDLDDVFLELSEKWSTLDRNSQRYIATIAAGSRQQSRFIAMMENYERTLELVETAYNSTGKSSEQFAKYQDTVEYKINQIKNAWEQLRINFFDSDVYKKALDILNKFVGTLNKMDAGQFIGAGLIGLTLGKSLITNFIKGIQTSSSAISKEIDKLKLTIAKRFKDKIKIIYDNTSIERVKQEMQRLGMETNQVTSSTGSLIIQYVKIKSELQRLEGLSNSQVENNEDLNNQLEERRQILRNITQELTRQNILSQQQIEAIDGDEGSSLRNAAQSAIEEEGLSTTASGISNIISGAITTALITGISTGDMGDSIATALLGGLTSAIPMVLEILIPKLIGLVTKAVAAIGATAAAVIGTVLAAAVAGVVVYQKIAKAQKTAEKAEINRLKNVKKINEELNKKQLSALKEINSLSKQQETLDDAVNAYELLSKKAFLTTEEQDKLNTAIDTLNTDYSDVIYSYDENTNELVLNTYALEELRKSLAEQKQNLDQTTKEAGVQRIINLTEADKKANEIAEKISKELYGAQITESGGAKVALAQVNSDNKRYKEYYRNENGRIIGVTETGEQEEVYRSQAIDLKEVKNLLGNLFSKDDIEKYFRGLDITQDFDDNESFIAFLEEAGYSVKAFSDAVSKEAKNIITDAQILSEARKVESLEYQNIEIEGLKIEEELADSLSHSITLEEITENDVEKKWNKARKTKDNKDFLRDTLQEIEKGINKNKTRFEIEEDYLDENEDIWADLEVEYQDIIWNTLQQWDKNNEQLTTGIDGNLKEWTELPKEFRDYLETTRDYSVDSWDNVRKDSEKTAKLLDEFWINKIIAQTNGFQGLTEEQIIENKDYLNKIQELFKNAALLTEETYLEQMTQIVDRLDKEVRDAVLSGQGLEWNAATNKVEYSTERVQGTSTNRYQITKEKFDANEIENYKDLALSTQETIISTLEDSNLNKFSREQLGQELVDLYSNLSKEQSTILSSVDILNSSYLDLLINSEQYIDGLVEAGMTATNAAQVYTNYIKMANKYISKSILGKGGATLATKTFEEQIIGFGEKFDVLFEAQEEMVEKGRLSTETYGKLLENGFDKYVEIGSNGYTLLTEKAEESWARQALAGKNNIEEIIANNKIWEEKASQLKPDIVVDVGALNNFWGSAAQKTAIKNIDELITKYKSLSDIEKSKLIDSISNEEAASLIAEIGESEYSTVEEFIAALQDGSAELEKAKPELWIQGLNLLTEKYAAVQEKVKELEEELEELNEELKDNQKEVNETYKEWQEALYGTENYMPSLDGLLNYTRQIEILQSELEKTKRLLEDVGNTEDASKLLNNTANLYEKQLGTIQAENKAIEQGLKNLDEEILSNYGNFVSFDEFNNMQVDFAALKDARMSDILKDEGFIELFEKRNELFDKYNENNIEFIEKQDEFNEMLSDARSKQIEIEENVIDILKEKMQEEIDVVEDKYKNLEEADNNYLDALEEAIEKQRKLREKENEYEDLATKEKKLSLMQRDTSGANQIETKKLEKEVEKDRQKLLDNEVDDLIDSMRELYKKQQEARELEIEAMEATIIDMKLISETAMNIVSGFKTIEDYQSWLLNNDPKTETMTIAQTEAYLEEAKDAFGGYAQYVVLTQEDIKLKTDKINQNADETFNNTSENITNLGTDIQNAAEEASKKAIDEAKEAYDDAVKKLEDTRKEIIKTQQELKNAQDQALDDHKITMIELVKASKEGLVELSTFATKELAKLGGYDLSNIEQAKDFAKKYNFVHNGEYSENFIDAVRESDGDVSAFKGTTKYKVMAHAGSGGNPYKVSDAPLFDSMIAAQEWIEKHLEKKPSKGNMWVEPVVGSTIYGEMPKYKQGGLVTQTGPAWVDGTPYKPESFLNANDTENLIAAMELLSDIQLLDKTSNVEEIVNTNVGDTSIEVHINVEKISDDYDVDDMIERVKKDIIDVTKPTGTPVILKK